MHFGNPEVLWLLPVWVVLALLGVRALAWRRRAARHIGQPELLDRLYPTEVRRWRRRRLALALAALLLLVVAAARPQYGRIERNLHSVGTNILVALDCSASMGARDVQLQGAQASRIEAAKRSLELLVHRLAGNRVGIVAFAGEAMLQCPMTLDQDMASMVLKSLDTDSVGVPGTDLGEAIDVATGAFERGSPDGGRALVLLTDGEDNEGKGLEAARRAKEKNVRIFAIGIGTSRGAPFPEVKSSDASGAPSFKEDTKTGAKVNSRLRMDTLDEIAKASGGGVAFAAGDAPAGAVDRVAAAIDNLQKTEIETRKQILYQDRFQWFLAPALLLLLVLLLLRPQPTRLSRQTA